MRFYSQPVNGHMMDRELLSTYLNVPNVDGVFLELGACDGLLYSNTKALEEQLNYTGVLIEPSPSFFQRLVVNRPRCSKYNCLVGTQEGSVPFIGDGSPVGGPLELLGTSYQLGAKGNKRSWIDAWGLDRGKVVNVLCRRLRDILHKSKVSYIDFWSLDVEGSELEVLKTMDWSIPVYLICMEVSHGWHQGNVTGSERTEACRQILRDQGFISDGKPRGLDELWINPNYPRKSLLYSSP